MPRLIRISILVSLLFASQAAIADDLFSEITITSVFGEKAESDREKTSPSSGNGRRITGASSLQKLLQDGGLTTQEVSSNTVAVALDAPQTKNGILNAVLVVHVDQGLINIGVPLVRIDESKVPASKLLQMMNQGRNDEAIYIVYSPDSKWIGARRSIGNQNMSSGKLVTELNEMVAFAQNTVDLWQPLGDTLKTVEKNEGTVEPKQKAAQPTQQTSFSLSGTWAALGPNGEGFGINFQVGKFELVISKDGKKTSSKGIWSLEGEQLKLVGDGMTLTGTITVKSKTQFELKLPNQNPLKFKQYN